MREIQNAPFSPSRTEHKALVDELMASGAAGFSRQTAIYLRSDPDHLPG